MLRYVDASFVIFDVEVRHPLVVVSELDFSLMIGTDIFRSHRASLVFVTSDFLRLNVDQCFVFVVERVPVTPR